jgi:hypothetical protein
MYVRAKKLHYNQHLSAHLSIISQTHIHKTKNSRPIRRRRHVQGKDRKQRTLRRDCTHTQILSYRASNN